MIWSHFSRNETWTKNCLQGLRREISETARVISNAFAYASFQASWKKSTNSHIASSVCCRSVSLASVLQPCYPIFHREKPQVRRGASAQTRTMPKTMYHRHYMSAPLNRAPLGRWTSSLISFASNAARILFCSLKPFGYQLTNHWCGDFLRQNLPNPDRVLASLVFGC